MNAFSSSLQRMHDIAAVITTWLRTEAAQKEINKNLLPKFVGFFLPIATLHFTAHVFLYIRIPTSPQYMVSFLFELVSLSKEAQRFYLAVFGCMELTLVTYNWILTFFYATSILGCTCTVDGLIRRATYWIRAPFSSPVLIELKYFLYI